MNELVSISTKEALAAIGAYVQAHPEIEISKTGLAIPKPCRDGFYETLDQARVQLARDVVSDDGFAAQSIEELVRVQKKLEDRLQVIIELPTELKAFCDDRFNGASQLFLSTMMSYVQGNVDEQGLIEAAEKTIASDFDRLTKAAYETWLFYAIIDALDPERAYLADTYDQKTVVTRPASVLELGSQQYSAVLRLPEAVFTSPHGTFGFKCELANEVDFYGSKPLRRRDFSTGGDSRNTVGRRYLLLYRFADPDSVTFIANRDKKLVVPPTAMCGAFFQGDVEQSLYCRGTLQRVLTLKPTSFACFTTPDGCYEDAVKTNETYESPATIVDTVFDLSTINTLIENI